MLSLIPIFPKKMLIKTVTPVYECRLCKLDFITLHTDVALCNDCYDSKIEISANKSQVSTNKTQITPLQNKK
jgi:Zn finger protein HypA/HybF involved in hydrogenase expression